MKLKVRFTAPKSCEDRPGGRSELPRRSAAESRLHQTRSTPGGPKWFLCLHTPPLTEGRTKSNCEASLKHKTKMCVNENLIARNTQQTIGPTRHHGPPHLPNSFGPTFPALSPTPNTHTLGFATPSSPLRFPAHPIPTSPTLHHSM